MLEYIKQNGKDSFLQHALALEYIKIDRDEEARNVFNEFCNFDSDMDSEPYLFLATNAQIYFSKTEQLSQ